MKKLNHTIFVLFLSILISSCAKMEIVDFNKDNNTRTIKFTYENGKTKLVNQKLHLKSNNWYEAICYDEILKLFKDCPDNKIDFTKVGKMQIAQLENNEQDSSNSQEQSSSNEQQSSNGQEQSSSNEEQNDQEDDGPDPSNPTEHDPFNPPEHHGECGPEIC